MLFHFTVLSWLALGVLSFMLPDQETFASLSDNKNPADIIEALHQAKIIPDVLDNFSPLVAPSITWESASASLGNTLPPSKLQHTPDIKITHIPSALVPRGIHLTAVLTDPDAPSREDPEWSQICHWIATSRPDQDHPLEVMPYKPPGPPPKTGKHRYVFVILAPTNGTTEELYPSKPKDRKHWGFESERAGVREWAEENGLSVIGANFIYAQNDKQ